MTEILKQFTQSNRLMTIRSVFQLNNEQGYCLNYRQSHQRALVWPEPKMTNFIETVILYGEVLPVVVYEKGGEEGLREVIDGKQRCESIDRFINNRLRLKLQGLDKLWHLAGKKFSQLDEKLRERIQQTKLRFIIIKAKNEKELDPYIEDTMRRQLFTRYNMGMSALRKEEVSKAQYLQDQINIYFKRRFKEDPQLYNQVTDTFNHRNRNIETIMQLIRQLLVLHHIPINRYGTDREDIINKYYDYISYKTINKQERGNIELIFNDFRKKFDLILQVKAALNENKIPSSGLVYECIYWALSVCEKEKVTLDEINHPSFKTRLVDHIAKRIQSYVIERSNYANQTKMRYGLIASFFNSQFGINFSGYLQSNEEFIVTHKELMGQYMKERFIPGLEEEHFSNSVPTSYTITDIIDKMKRGKFLLRPPYQRDETMNTGKASLLIESILLDIMLYPIYVYIRNDEVTEVIDGQQRLLAILGFLGEEYRNEFGKMEPSKKNKFSLRLKPEQYKLHNKKFVGLSDPLKRDIYKFEINVIEIREQENKYFKPEEFFKRLNSKPFPIKGNSFEYWNACLDSDIVSAIKDICQRNSWLCLRKDDKRMLNEELVTCLCFLHYMKGRPVPDFDSMKEVLSIHPSRSCITVKIKNKAYVTQVLQTSAFKEEFLQSLNSFETDFIEKVALLTSNPAGKTTEYFRSRQLDTILQTGRIRVAANFYVLWLVLKGIPIEYIKEARSTVRNKINKVFSALKTPQFMEKFESAIIEAWHLAD